jgi:hypothetical protein
MLKMNIQVAEQRMLAANQALRDYVDTEPFSSEIARALVRDSINATDEYLAAVDEYLAATGNQPIPK